MKKKPTKQMRSEYDFSNGVRGKYARQYQQGIAVVLLDRELPASSPTPTPRAYVAK
jgi:hypothetical protein